MQDIYCDTRVDYTIIRAPLYNDSGGIGWEIQYKHWKLRISIIKTRCQADYEWVTQKEVPIDWLIFSSLARILCLSNQKTCTY